MCVCVCERAHVRVGVILCVSAIHSFTFKAIVSRGTKKKNGNHTLHTFIHNRQKQPKKGHFKLINGSSCFLCSSVQAQFNT